MSGNASLSVALKSRSGLISDSANIVLDSILNPTIIIMSLCGLVTNSLNIRTFVAMGLKDGVTLSFFILSCSDLAFAFTCVMAYTGRFLVFLESNLDVMMAISPNVLFIFGETSAPITSMTCVTTAYIALVRCACVVRPLQFREMFSRMKTSVFLGSFAVLFSSTFVPICAKLRLVYIRDTGGNFSRIGFATSGEYRDMNMAIQTFSNVIIPIVTQIVVLVCVPVLVNALKAATAFREGSTVTSERNTTEGKEGTNGGKLDRKETQVITQVVLISVLFITCNFTIITYCIAIRVESEFYFGKLYDNLHDAVTCLIVIALLASTNLNIFVYLKYNSSFRRCFVVQR